MIIRALLDTNILVSYLLAPEGEGAVVQVVRAGLAARYVLLLSLDLLSELEETTRGKAYLPERLQPDQVASLVEILSTLGEILPALPGPTPAMTRDRKDDQLLAYALFGQADYLVTSDRDLLVLARAGEVRIVTPREFWDILAQQPNPLPTEN